MTREQKLALIVGFSLVLVLGVLLSDHLSSRTRNLQPPLAGVHSGQAQDFGAENPLADRAPVAQPPVPSSKPPHDTQAMTSAPPGLAGRGEEISAPLASRTAPGGASDSLPYEIVNGVPPASPRGSTASPDVLASMRTDALPRPLPSTSLPVSRESLRRHDIRENESIYALASRIYGDGALWTKIRDYPGNQGKIGPKGQVQIGTTILLAPKDVLLGRAVLADPRVTDHRAVQPVSPLSPASSSQPAQAARPPNSAPADRADARTITYTVKSGDTLASIARKRLGSTSRVSDIIALNRALADDPDSLNVGDVIKLPARGR